MIKYHCIIVKTKLGVVTWCDSPKSMYVCNNNFNINYYNIWFYNCDKCDKCNVNVWITWICSTVIMILVGINTLNYFIACTRYLPTRLFLNNKILKYIFCKYTKLVSYNSISYVAYIRSSKPYGSRDRCQLIFNYIVTIIQIYLSNEYTSIMIIIIIIIFF